MGSLEGLYYDPGTPSQVLKLKGKGGVVGGWGFR